MAKKTKRFAGGGATTTSEPITVVGRRNTNLFESSSFRPDFGGAAMRNYSIPAGGAVSIPDHRLSPSNMPNNSGSGVSFGGISTPVGKVYGPRGIPIGNGSFSAGASPMGGGRIGGTASFPFKKGGKVKKMAKGGSVSSASKRADGCATKGKTKGRFV
jgi:hypothetical protein